MVRTQDKQNQKEIAKERIEILMKKADEVFNKNKSLANRYVTLARKISMKSNVRFTRELKRKFCKHCYKFLKPGINVRIRTKEGKVVYYCFECKKFMRFPYLKEKKSS
jgi:ribonuclease P protein subunit RPR2